MFKALKKCSINVVPPNGDNEEQHIANQSFSVIFGAHYYVKFTYFSLGFSRDHNLPFHTTYVVCIIFMYR